jgi:pimeloyl-ACP methyl ester carboxylesterase
LWSPNFWALPKYAPLRLRTAVRLDPGEHFVAYAWDGAFFLPVGAARQVDGTTEIELRQLPAPLELSEDLQRGIVSSVRILFQKLVSPYLGTEYDYPRLAAVSFDTGAEPTYDHAIEQVRRRVAAARRILLYIHGILGDTLGMTSSREPVALLNAAPQRIGDRYDLVLAFDYENIHTDIESTARALKEKLAAVGLGPDHGKTLHVAAHSMGGLVSRWFIEREQGNRVVQHLVTLGTPHAGSPWPTIEGLATTALALGLNGLSAAAWPAKLLGQLAGAIEAVDVTLDEMAPNSPFLATLGQSADPAVPYTLLAGNTSITARAAGDGTLQALLARLAPQRVLHAATALAFLKRPNDIAVAVTSAKAVPQARAPAPTVAEVGCDHITFFSSDAGRQALLDALLQASTPLVRDWPV